jgi:hypothetical protein
VAESEESEIEDLRFYGGDEKGADSIFFQTDAARKREKLR